MFDQIKRANELQQRKLTLEIELKEVDNELKTILEKELPDLMLAKRLTVLTTSDGSYKLKKQYHGGVGYANAAEAAELLQKYNYHFDWEVKGVAPQNSGIERYHDIYLPQANGNTIPVPVKSKPNIAHQTFKKICREIDEKGGLTPDTEKLLGVVTSYKVELKGV